MHRSLTLLRNCLCCAHAVLLLCPGDGLNTVLGSVLRGAGRQWWGASLNLFGWWGLGVPLAAALALPSMGGLNVQGLWAGFAVASAVQAAAQYAVVSRLDWDQEVGCAPGIQAGRRGGKAGHACQNGKGRSSSQIRSSQIRLWEGVKWEQACCGSRMGAAR